MAGRKKKRSNTCTIISVISCYFKAGPGRARVAVRLELDNVELNSLESGSNKRGNN